MQENNILYVAIEKILEFFTRSFTIFSFFSLLWKFIITQYHQIQ